MAMTLRKRAPRPQQEEHDRSPPRKKPKRPSRRPRARKLAPRRRVRLSRVESSSEEDVVDDEEEEEEEEEDEVPEYERIREQRMRENKEKMEKLGIFSLSQKFKPPVLPRRRPSAKRKPSVTRSFVAPYERSRRSDRLKEVGRVSYFKNEGTLESMGIHVPEAWAPEVYTEEHEKLLGDCDKSWTLYVDGYGEDGERLYDPLNGKMCHQCRQKTVGNFSICRKCKSAQGQLCGDCLYMRYGENVLEVNENTNWSCPCCRDICNCSRCRRAKGWAPVVCVYEKVIEQGHKSIAHYLIRSRSAKKKKEDNAVAADDADVNPDVNSQPAHIMKYHSDSSDGSTDEEEPEGYNSDLSVEVELNQKSSIEVLDDEEGVETGKVSDKEEEVLLITELKDVDDEQPMEADDVCN